MTIRGINTQVEVQATLDAPLTITGITLANPAVVTVTGTAPATGDVVRLATTGMVKLNGWAGRVTNLTGTTFALDGVDSTTYAAFVSGTATEVLTWDSFDSLTNISLPNQAADRLDKTTLHDSEKQETLGLPGAVSGTMTGFFAPTEAAVVNLRQATRDTETRVFRLSFETGEIAVFNADASAGQGFDMAVNQLATASYDLAIKKFVNFYAS